MATKPNYTWNGEGWDSQPVAFARLEEIRFALNLTGDPAHADVAKVRDAYLGYDQNNAIIDEWFGAPLPEDRENLELAYPWLLDGTQRPADDLAGRQVMADALQADWTWRRFKAQRAGQVSQIVVTRDSDGMEFEGDEISQDRLNRMVTLGSYKLLDALMLALDDATTSAFTDSSEFAAHLHQAMANVIPTLTQPWKTAPNTVDQLSYDEAAELAEKAGAQQSSLWFGG